MKILIVDDEKILVKGITFNLEHEGYEVDSAYNGEDGLRMARENKYDLIVLDLMMPKVDGLEACKQIREFSEVPIIMLTARGEDKDKILGFEYGADDYVTKPFNILELKSRIRAILRRVNAQISRQEKDSKMSIGHIFIDSGQRSVVANGRAVELTAKEFDLLELLVRNAGRVYSRESLLDVVWGFDFPGDIRTVDVHVRRIREKIETNPAEPVYILTKWGVGYYCKA